MPQVAIIVRCLLLAMTVTATSWAEEPTKRHGVADPHPPWFIMNVSYGAGAMEFYDNGKAILPVSLTLQPGFRFRVGRVGATARWLHNGDGQDFLEAGLFGGVDFFSIEQDRHRSLAAYGRVESSLRGSLDRPDSLTLVTAAFLGLRVFGIYVEAGFGPVFGPFDLPPYPKDLMGMTGEGRVGVELLEFISCFDAGCFGGSSR